MRRRTIKSAVILEDLSSLSSISMNVAVPIVASFGLRALSIPVQLLATQSEVGDDHYGVSLNKWLNHTLETAHQQIQKQEDYGLVGYLGRSDLVDELLQSKLINDFKLLLIDPAMADQGKYYPNLDDAYMRKLRQLLQFADVVTPNMTELALLTEMPYSEQLTESELNLRINQLRKYLKPEATVIVTGIEQTERIGCFWDANVSHGTYFLRKIPGHFYGTGDAFAATLLGKLAQDEDLTDAIPEIMQLMQAVVENTHLSTDDLKLGIDITRILQRDKKLI